MVEHAPTPWQIGIALYPYVHFYGPSDKAGGALAVGACVTALGKEYDEANAAFIVKAVNNHEALVAALKNAQKLIAEAAMTGFNWKDGDWAERLFESQQTTSTALRDVVGSPASAFSPGASTPVRLLPE